MKLRVECAELGTVINMRMEKTVEDFKQQISLLLPIEPQNQILLIGPPFKILDPQYGPHLQTEGKRIFVYDRSVLLDQNKEPNRILLLPYDIPSSDVILSDAFRTLPENFIRSTSSSLHKSILEYEQYFYQQLQRGYCYDTFVKESYNACRSCMLEQQVQLDAISAAISNLKDTYDAVANPYEMVERRLSKQQNYHKYLNENFENNLNKLLDVQLHPALINAIEKFKIEGSTSSISSATLSNTLYDCIPVDRERSYWKHSVESYFKSEESLNRIRLLFESISIGVNSLNVPVINNENLSLTLEKMGLESVAQTEYLNHLINNYQNVYDLIISMANEGSLLSISGELMSLTESKKQNFIQMEKEENNDIDVINEQSSIIKSKSIRLEKKLSIDLSQIRLIDVYNSYGNEILLQELHQRRIANEKGKYLLNMSRSASDVKDMKNEFEKSKTLLLRSIYDIMRRIATLQNEIHNKFKRDLEWMKKWITKENKYITHFEPIAQLPMYYDHFLTEIARRGSFNKAQWLPDITYEDLKIKFLENSTDYDNNNDNISNNILSNPIESFETNNQTNSHSKINNILQNNHNSLIKDDESMFLSSTIYGKSLISMNNYKENQNNSPQNQRGGSVILPAMHYSEEDSLSYVALKDKYNNLQYENTKLLTIIADLKSKLEVKQPTTPIEDDKQPRIKVQSHTVVEIGVNTEPEILPQIIETINNNDKILEIENQNYDKNKLEETKKVDILQSEVIKDYQSSKQEIKSFNNNNNNNNNNKQLENDSLHLFSEFVNDVMEGFLCIKDVLNYNQDIQDYIIELLSKKAIDGDINAKLRIYDNKNIYFHSATQNVIDVGDTIKEITSLAKKVSQSLNYNIRNQKSSTQNISGNTVEVAMKGPPPPSSPAKESIIQNQNQPHTPPQFPLYISFMDFQVGDIALFIPIIIDNKKLWGAFHANRPNRYLSE
eukprot:gene5054-7055_t